MSQESIIKYKILNIGKEMKSLKWTEFQMKSCKELENVKDVNNREVKFSGSLYI